jgi:hypothetical protein
MSQMHYWDAHWDLRINECPCDTDFTQYMREKELRNKTIFHFGTGGHHHFGHAFHEMGGDNLTLGITASPSEYEAYVKLAIERPEIARIYKVFFGDIYQMERRLLPTFDIVTLFHMCEFRNEKNDTYQALSDRDVIELFMDTLNPDGELCFYSGSFAWPQAKVIVDDLVKAKKLSHTHTFKTLEFYKTL